MWKLKIFLRFDKEEAWLEQMARKGWLLTQTGIFRDFRRITPEEKTIRIDYRIFKSRQDFNEYRTLFADSGWQHLAGTKSSGAQYFLKSGADSTEDIFSDQLSQAGRYRRVSEMYLCTTMSLVSLLIAMIYGEADVKINALLTPKQWYLTPGLWELKGTDFWWSFLFETPFAVMRGLGWILPILGVLLYGVYAVRSWLLYRSAIVKS